MKASNSESELEMVRVRGAKIVRILKSECKLEMVRSRGSQNREDIDVRMRTRDGGGERESKHRLHIRSFLTHHPVGM